MADVTLLEQAIQDWPLAGRDCELAALLGRLASPEAGAVLLVAAPGGGRTRLARAALARAAADGMRTGWVAGTAGEGAAIRFGAVAHLLPAGRTGPEHPPLALLQAGASRFERWGGRARVAVGVDDAHLLDDASAALLTHLARQRLAFLLLTARRGAALPDALAGLCRDDDVLRLSLPALPPAAIDALLGAALPGGLDGVSRHLLHRVAWGSPTLLAGLLRAGARDGALHTRCGLWRWEGRCEPAWPALSRSAGTGGARPALDLLACTDPLPLALVEGLAGEAAMQLAEESGLAAVVAAGARLEVQLAGPVQAAALRGTLSPGRLRALCRALVQAALQGPLRRRDDALRVALWQLGAGIAVRPELLAAGAQRALNQGDPVLAERLARFARQRAASPALDALLGQLRLRRHGAPGAAAVLATPPPAAGAARATWAASRARVLYGRAVDLASVERVLDTARAGPGSDLVEATRCWILLLAGQGERALAGAGRVLEDPASDTQAQLWAAGAGTAAAGLLGQADRAWQLARQGRRLAAGPGSGLPWASTEIGVAVCLAGLLAGEAGPARTSAGQGYQAAVEAERPLSAAVWVALRGLAELAAGHLVPARASLREALAATEYDDPFRLGALCAAGLAAATAGTGDGRAAAGWLERADRLAGRCSPLLVPWLERHRAWALLVTDTPAAAVAAVARAALLARELASPGLETAALYDVVRLGGEADLGRLGALRAQPGGPFAEAAFSAAAGLAAGDPDALARAAAGFRALGHDLLAAEAGTAAAREYGRRGRRPAVQRMRALTAAAYPRCDPARTPLLGADRIDSVLTPREREIIGLARRHRSREIAARLGLSVRTVDNTLGRAYLKLGVSGRAGLRTLPETGAGPAS